MNYDAAIIGSGPNGLAAAIRLQQQGLNTIVVEQATKPGGSARTEELTIPGYLHDVCSSIHPLAYESPFFKKLNLESHGLKWIFPQIPFAQPLSGGEALACYQSVENTAEQLGRDKDQYLDIFSRLNGDWTYIAEDILSPLSFPKHPLPLIRFGIKAVQSARFFVRQNFRLDSTRIFFYGAAAHSTLPLDYAASSAFGLVLMATAHHSGWPFPEGGSVNIINALIRYYESIGGKLILNMPVMHLDDLPSVNTYIFDVTPQQLLKIGGTNFGSTYRRRLEKYRYGAGVFKVDWALNAPIPWLNEKCRTAGTIHIGYSPEEIERSEKIIYKNGTNTKPYVLMAQHSVFDTARAPGNMHTAWGYCHVPQGSDTDMVPFIEAQIEKAAPGFKDCIIARSAKDTFQMRAFNPNMVGGDINGGMQDLRQLFTRPVVSLNPYSTPDPKVFICSASTPPGGGVHGMCGYNAANAVLKKMNLTPYQEADLQ